MAAATTANKSPQQQQQQQQYRQQQQQLQLDSSQQHLHLAGSNGSNYAASSSNIFASCMSIAFVVVFAVLLAGNCVNGVSLGEPGAVTTYLSPSQTSPSVWLCRFVYLLRFVNYLCIYRRNIFPLIKLYKPGNGGALKFKFDRFISSIYTHDISVEQTYHEQQ